MGKVSKVFGMLVLSLLISIGLTVCSLKRQADIQIIGVNGTVTNIPQLASPTPSEIFTPYLSSTPSSTVTPIAVSPSAVPPTHTLPPFQPTHTLLPLTPTPVPLFCLNQPGRIERGNITPVYLQYQLSIRIYLPPCYDDLPEKRYPVLFLIHGQGYNDDQWERLGITKTADELIASGDVPPFLIVMPRDREWTRPSKDKFGQAIVEDLLPWIDAHYRTLPEHKSRAIGGLSRGAAWAVHLGLSRWDLFSAIGAHSLAVFLEDESEIEGWINQIPSEYIPRIYLDIGDRDRIDIMESAVWFETLLTDIGIPHEWHLFPGEHIEVYWQSHVEQYLRWYAAEW